MPTMRRGDLEGSGARLSRKADLLAQGRHTRYINALTTFDCAVRIGSDTELMATLMVGDLRGRARSSTNRGSPGINVQTWPESGVLVPLRVLVNSRPGPFYPCPGLLVQTVYTQNYPVNMVRERKRLLSHRGSSRGGTSWRPAVEEIHPPCHCPHCHCFCHCPRSEHANPNKPSQFMEASSPGTSSAPFFGSQFSPSIAP